MNVLIVHNRYRQAGGEARAVELQASALERAGVTHRVLMRDSGGLGGVRAGRAMLRGGEEEQQVADAVRDLRADVAHFHNMHPLFGPRALAAARRAGARVVLQLHNFRLFCAIGVAFRDGAPCFRCRGRLTLPGLALNCRGSLPESAVYATALSLHQPAVMESVDRFATLSRYAAGQLVRLGVPAERLDVVPNYVSHFASRSTADRGSYAVVVSRLSSEKGIDIALEAARLSGVPLRVAGDGPLRQESAEFLGHVGDVRSLLDGAAMALVPSRGGDVMPFAALEAMARGVPVIASRTGSLPEIVGAENCVRRGDPEALAQAMRALWDDRERRRAEGDAALSRVRERFSEDRYVSALQALYRRTRNGA